nr:GAF domain-containing protein [Lachnospiraceae bacterium]
MKTYTIDQLIKVAIALTAEKDLKTLMDLIVCEAMEISNCDGGTLYIKDGNVLQFESMFTKSKGILKSTFNSEKRLPPVPISADYVSGRCALNAERINIDNIYESDAFDFSGTKRYDEMNNYRTESMLVLPMEDEKGKVIGVLQLINAQDEDGNIIPFGQENENLIFALSSLAAVALNNHQLSDQISDMLHSFVKVMITAIEARSKYNSNHT